jgi:hypothetical protein
MQVQKLPSPICVIDVARRAVIENFRAHPYTRSVCLETARLFEQHAAKHLVEAQDSADRGVTDSALELQTKARVDSSAPMRGTSVRKTPPTKHRARKPDEYEVVNVG